MMNLYLGENVCKRPYMFTGVTTRFLKCHGLASDCMLEDKLLPASSLVTGDIIEFERESGYHHCAVYKAKITGSTVFVEDDTVIHITTAPGVGGVQTSLAKWNNDIRVRTDRIRDVAGNSQVYRNNMFDTVINVSKEEIILRAKASIGEADYDLLFNNCQHYCTNIRYGFPFSREADWILNLGFSTSARHGYKNEMVKVSLDDVYWNLTISDSSKKQPLCILDTVNYSFDLTSSSGSKSQMQSSIPAFDFFTCLLIFCVLILSKLLGKWHFLGLLRQCSDKYLEQRSMNTQN